MGLTFTLLLTDMNLHAKDCYPMTVFIFYISFQEQHVDNDYTVHQMKLQNILLICLVTKDV